MPAYLVDTDLKIPLLTTESHGGQADDASYVLGLEIGILYGRMHKAERPLRMALHKENLEQADLVAMRHSFKSSIVSSSGKWAIVEFWPQSENDD